MDHDPIRIGELDYTNNLHMRLYFGITQILKLVLNAVISLTNCVQRKEHITQFL